VLNYTSIFARKWVKLDNEHCYKQVAKLVATSPERKVTMLWNQQVQTERTVRNKKLDIIFVVMKKEHVC
jgi:hypothetical protein